MLLQVSCPAPEDVDVCIIEEVNNVVEEGKYALISFEKTEKISRFLEICIFGLMN